ncbi:hypothetical protein HF086_010129 [Spodoptera exigua]|uniref:Uncharacterized protein n=1 Tax=Spodoptera exigua TaxID=7107 RepID=A0A922MJD6_SPOEX|nr:hypothetical protein HF086_010129 [Spodoptera exigua]
MAFKLFTLFTLCVFLHMVFSLPIGDEIKSPVSAEDETLIPSQLDPYENSVVDNSYSPLNVLKRVKRSFIGGDNCSEGMRWFINDCITEEKYDEIMGEKKR